MADTRSKARRSADNVDPVNMQQSLELDDRGVVGAHRPQWGGGHKTRRAETIDRRATKASAHEHTVHTTAIQQVETNEETCPEEEKHPGMTTKGKPFADVQKAENRFSSDAGTTLHCSPGLASPIAASGAMPVNSEQHGTTPHRQRKDNHQEEMLPVHISRYRRASGARYKPAAHVAIAERFPGRESLFQPAQQHRPFGISAERIYSQGRNK